MTHIDSLIYLDTDVIVLSNMTKFWEHFHVHMDKQQMIATPPNNPESIHGCYKPELKIPYVGERGRGQIGGYEHQKINTTSMLGSYSIRTISVHTLFLVS